MKLKRLTNNEYDEAESRAGGIPLDECPTCGARSDEDGDCENCEEQRSLRKHYLAANIGDQFQRLDWSEYDNESVKEYVTGYLNKWTTAKRLGTGIEFYSKRMGSGKTFSATYVAKELIKKGEQVFFIPFDQMVSTYSKADAEKWEARLKGVTVLVLDEVIAPTSVAQGMFFSTKFEELIRHRTNYNLPTITTANLTPTDFEQHYPRLYSLLDAKQIKVEVIGKDARQGRRAEKNFKLLMEEKVEPIT